MDRKGPQRRGDSAGVAGCGIGDTIVEVCRTGISQQTFISGRRSMWRLGLSELGEPAAVARETRRC